VYNVPEIVLFHSAYGRRPAVFDFAETARAAGHVVHVPDLFDGEVFESLEEGVAKRDALGMVELARRAAASVEGLSPGLVYAGFSMGCGPAQLLAQTRAGARGALLMHGALPAAAFETPWPAAVALEVHGMDEDPHFDVEIARRLVGEAADGALHLYPGSAHLFADPGLPDFDERAASLMTRRALAFFARC
jgi:dienelactone hydrolase